MLRLTYPQKWLLSGLFLVGAGCAPTQSQPEVNSTAVIAPTPAPTPAPLAIAPTQTAAQVNVYQQALNKANSANNLSQTASSEDDWNLVASRWQQAIASLKSLSPSSPYQGLAKTKLPQFERGLAMAKRRAVQAKSTADDRTSGSLVSAAPLNVTSPTTAAIGAGKVFQAQIKRRAGGTPVIDVTFNGSQTFEMIVDTGASGTVITQAAADALGVQIIGKTKVNTASQTGVEVPLAYVDSIAVGGAVVKEVIVAIANDALDIGLLGHDFFNDYDVTVKQDVVEFRKR